MINPASVPNTTMDPASRISHTRIPEPAEAPPAGPQSAFQVHNLSIWYGEKQAVKDVTIDFPE
jgi:hypothetical protein